MIKASIYFAALSLTGSPLVAQTTPPPSQKPEVLTRQWQVKNNAAPSRTDAPNAVKPSVPYELHNSRLMEMGLGSQLERFHFVRNGSTFMFRRPNEGAVRDHRPLRPDEDVALYHVETRLYTIAGGWRQDACYDWQLHHLRGDKFALYNSKVKKYLVLISEGEKPNTTAGWHVEKKPKPKGWFQTEGSRE